MVLPVDGHAADALSDVEVDVGDDDEDDDDRGDGDGSAGPTSAGSGGAAAAVAGSPSPPRPLSAMHSPSVSSVFAANDRNAARNAAGDRVGAQKRVTVARMSKRELALVLKLRARQLRYVEGMRAVIRIVPRRAGGWRGPRRRHAVGCVRVAQLVR